MGSLYLAHTNGEKQLELRTYESRGTYFLTLEDASTASRNDLRYWCDKENRSAMSSDSKHLAGCVMYRHKMGNISRKGELLVGDFGTILHSFCGTGMKSTRVSRFVQNNKQKHISVQGTARWKVEMKILSIAKTNLIT